MATSRTDMLAMERVAPPVSAIEALGRNMLYQFLHALNGTDAPFQGNATDVARVLVEKAKGGDMKAMKEFISLLTVSAGVSGSERSPGGGVNQVVSVSNTNAVVNDAGSMSEFRRNLVYLLNREGPLKSDVIAVKTLHQNDRALLAQALNHDRWFSLQRGRWNITEEARAEVLAGVED